MVVTQNGEPIVHNLGTGTLRIDVPLPPSQPRAPAAVASTAPAPARRTCCQALGRLEKLRLENQATPGPQGASEIAQPGLCLRTIVDEPTDLTRSRPS